MDTSLEYSTKILEYGAAGCACILNDNALHKQLLGEDYPFYANDPTQVERCLRLSLEDSDLVQHAAATLASLARRHTFSKRVADLRNWLEEDAPFATTILVAGHDLKFFRPLGHLLESRLGYSCIYDEWNGHAGHDERSSQSLLGRADVIFCEWSLGNVEWYSKNKRENQRLVTRFHRQELTQNYLNRANLARVDHISFVAEHVRREALATFPLDPEKTSVIPNLIDPERFQPLSKTGDAPFTIGMIGYVPAMKRLDRALDILEELLKRDQRYRLRLKGVHPYDYDWLRRRPDEVEYYNSQFRRINASDTLRYRVIFDPPGEDVNSWLRMVGFVLSVSDFESFHMAVGEGMLTGSIPIVWRREGCEIWPAEYIIDSAGEAAALIDQLRPSGDGKAKDLRNYVTTNFDVNRIVSAWRTILDTQSQRATRRAE